jgi:HSP20 family molecular chaperone IbpA
MFKHPFMQLCMNPDPWWREPENNSNVRRKRMYREFEKEWRLEQRLDAES